MGFLRLVSLSLILAFFLAAPSNAQAPSDPPVEASARADQLSGLTPEERAELLSRLSDQEARALLIEYLEARDARPGGAESVLAELESQAGVFRQNLAKALSSAPELLSVPGFMIERLSAGRSAWHPLLLVVLFGVIACLAWGAERLFLRVFSGVRGRLAAEAEGLDYVSVFARNLLALAIDLLGLVAFAAVIAGLFFITYQGHEPSRTFILELLGALLILRVAILVSRPLFHPKGDLPPLIAIADDGGAMLHRHLVWSAGVGAFGFALCGFIYAVGFAQDPHRLMTLIVGTAMVGVLVAGIWRVRGAVARSLRGQEEPLDAAAGATARSLGALLAGLWHLPVVAYVLAVYVFAVFSGFSGQQAGTYPGVLSLGLLLLLLLCDRLFAGLLERMMPAAADQAGARGVFESASHILVAVVGVGALALIWDAPLFSFDEGGIGARLVRAALDIALTVFIGFLLWGLVKAAVARHLPAESDAEESRGDEGGGASTTRLGTILPLLMKVTQITIATMVVMVALSALGVNIGPLLAGAGVIGLAVGFGAQTLVRDLVSGMFFLIDDAFRKGEYVDVGVAKGTVERINMRSLVLRHHMGPLHTIPYGEIQSLSNFSRDWVIMKLEFRVGYDTDPNKVKKIFKKIGAEMLEDPVHGPDFLEPFKSQGVKAMEDSAMIVRGKFMAKPGKQFTIRKEIYNRVRQAFEENGIEFAHRRVTVELPEDVTLSPEQQKRVAEAAGAAAAAEDEAAAGGGEGSDKT